MVSLRYTKTQTKETEAGKDIKINFTGSENGLKYYVTVDGSKENIEKFLMINRIKFYGQEIEVDIENQQQEVE